MAKAEGKRFKFDDETSIRADFLETIDYKGETQNITFETDELSAVCPFSGLPDFSKLKIQYIPDKKIVELKSLKYYLISFRNIGIYQEELTDRIYKDLKALLKPQYIRIETNYNVRGGILSTCVVESDKN
ncbi:MAG: preQ(1) synthase [Candidatus Delongbacteria bacterium]|nr:preQ(1) synthase [Candidatus Delongbacteria bacterium]MCG2759904.1 preQ(1) synthase [Candidatus Delongbacteria bacterium]